MYSNYLMQKYASMRYNRNVAIVANMLLKEAAMSRAERMKNIAAYTIKNPDRITSTEAGLNAVRRMGRQGVADSLLAAGTDPKTMGEAMKNNRFVQDIEANTAKNLAKVPVKKTQTDLARRLADRLTSGAAGWGNAWDKTYKSKGLLQALTGTGLGRAGLAGAAGMGALGLGAYALGRSGRSASPVIAE